MGTPENIKKILRSRTQDQEEEGSDQTSSSDDDEDEDGDEDENDDAQEQSFSSFSSEDEHGGTYSRLGADQIMEASIDLSISPTEPAEANEGTTAPLIATRPSFSEALDSSQDISLGT